MFDWIKTYPQQRKQKEEQSPEQIILQERLMKMMRRLSAMGSNRIDRVEIRDRLIADDQQQYPGRQKIPLADFQGAIVALEKKRLINKHGAIPSNG